MTTQEQSAKEIAIHTAAYEAIPQSERKQTTRIDEDPELLKWAEHTVRSMNESAEKLERARSEKSREGFRAQIKFFQDNLSARGILWEEDHDRYSVMKTEKQLLAIATMIRQLNLDYERRQIERMYQDIEQYLERARRLIADALPEIREHRLGRLTGSNDLQYSCNKVHEIATQVEAYEKLFKAMELPTLPEKPASERLQS